MYISKHNFVNYKNRKFLLHRIEINSKNLSEEKINKPIMGKRIQRETNTRRIIMEDALRL